jgi:LmbE family N-acetylglucosaminyl deacetylase
MSRHLPTTPIAISIPRRLILFSPHPDDIAISIGALAAWAAPRVPVTIVLMTDGSEAQLPEHVLQPHIDCNATVGEKQRARGMMRVQEATREAVTLGFDSNIVHLLHRQSWFLRHRTPAGYMNPDRSLRDVNGFVPGPVDKHAIAEIRDIIGSGSGIICAVPDPNDQLTMHRMTTQLVAANRGEARLLTYECLSTIEVTAPQTVFPFDEDLMDRKCAAILEHHSMRERRKQFGGYTNPGTEFYDVIVREKNRALARRLGLAEPYAERFGWNQ